MTILQSVAVCDEMVVRGAPTPTISSRTAVRPGDEAFLHDLYAETRAADFAGLPTELADQVVRLQHEAREAAYGAAYADLADEILEEDARPVGRILVARRVADLHVVDLAVAVGARGRGVATHALTRWRDRAAAEGRLLTLTVADDNPAGALYESLGFRMTSRPSAGCLGMVLDPRRTDLEETSS